jgi:hypothetical protein
VAVEEIVTENEAGRFTSEELFPDEESLREAFRLRLRCVGNLQAPLGAIA